MENRIDLAAGVLLCVLGVLGATVAIPLGIKEPSSVQFAALSPSYWPRIVCLALAAMGLAIAAIAVMKRNRDRDAHADAQAGWLVLARQVGRVALALGLMFGSYMVLEPLGFVLTAVLVLLLFMLVAGERNPLVMVPISLGVPVLLYVFFTKVASIPIPNGVLETVLAGGA